MHNNFILLTSDNGEPIIIGTNNIAIIESFEIDRQKSRITLNYPGVNGAFPNVKIVKESFMNIKSALEL